MNILIAPNAFKNSLNARQATRAIEQGLQLSNLECATICFPIADGGDGTGSLIIDACGGKVIWKEVHDPLGRKIDASFGLIDNGKTAVIEMADASGLKLLKKEEYKPLIASSRGTGELILFALDEGVEKIIIAMGGSATVDGGCGILQALGLRFLDDEDDEIEAIPEYLVDIEKIDASLLDKRILNCEIVIHCDVDSKLLGKKGAAEVFGPQKGASPGDVIFLDFFLTNFADVTQAQTGVDISNIKHSGTAGGAAAGLHAWLNAKLVNGIDNFLNITNFDAALQNCALLITGEGSLDVQTLQGKGPFGVAKKAKENGITVVGIAGKIPKNEDEGLNQYFDIMVPINNEVADLETAIENTCINLIRTAKMVGDLLALKLKC